jgi:cob(I)alamin adenosyltransferase
MRRNGLIQVYTGISEETNFAPFGLGLRAAGHNFRTLITCFTPHGLMEACPVASSLLKPNLLIDHSAIEGIPIRGKPIRDDVLNALKKSARTILEGDFDIVVLNGILQLMSQGVVTLEDILPLMEEKPARVELVLSGAGMSKEVMERADLVTEMIVNRREPEGKKKNAHEEVGTVEVITGGGKGKTTYCLGKALLTSCREVPSFILQVIKSPKAYGEVMAIERLPFLQIKSMGKGFLNGHGTDFDKNHIKAAREAWEYWLRKIYSLRYGLLVLDEINIATYYGLIRSERVHEMIFLKPEKLNLLLSGRQAHPDVARSASTVIEMKEIKHPFRDGVKARKGIEF